MKGILRRAYSRGTARARVCQTRTQCFLVRPDAKTSFRGCLDRIAGRERALERERPTSWEAGALQGPHHALA